VSENKQFSKTRKNKRFARSSNPGSEAREKPVSLKPLKVEDALRGLLEAKPEDGSDG